MEKMQEDFIKWAFFAKAWHDAAQHGNKIFISNDDNVKEQFKTDLKEWSYEIIKNYQRNEYTSLEHTEIIDKFYNKIKGKYDETQIVFTFGRSQKLINVLLKYYWCAGLLGDHKPAQMPIDRNILKELKVTNICWTTMDKNKYMECINIAQDKCKKDSISLAEWELEEFNKLINIK